MKYIGLTSTAWGNDYSDPGGSFGPGMFADYTSSGGKKQSRNLGQDMGWLVADVQRVLLNCAGEIAAAGTTIASFVSTAWNQYGPAIQAAIGMATFGSLPLLEGLGVILTTLSAPEIAGLALMVGVSALVLWALYVCVSNNT